MGSLKDDMRALREDHKPSEKTDDGERPGSSDGVAEPEGPEINTSQESTNQQPKLHMNASHAEDGDKNAKSKDQVLSGEDYIKDSSESGGTSPTQQPQDDEATTESTNTTISNKLLSDADGHDVEIQGGTSMDKNVAHDREKEEDVKNILVPVPATTGPSDPRSPAPFGQQHMRTQVSLEVVQCCSAATSPMTPPEGSHSFFFPSSFGKSGGVGTDTKDAELQVGRQVEFCSVATSPMTPKTPSTTAFPALIGRDTVQKEEIVIRSEEQRGSGQQENFPVTKSPGDAESELIGALQLIISKEPSEGFSSNVSSENSTSCAVAGLKVSQITLQHGNQQCKQQRMGSMDQDITILVTHHGSTEEEETENAEPTLISIETQMIKTDDELSKNRDVKNDVQDTSNAHIAQSKAEESSFTAHNKPETSQKSENSEIKEIQIACGELSDVTKPRIPESPAPFGCHNIHTQVSLEVVQCQSAATSPMTPPEGDHAFYFPSSLGTCGGVGTETKDAELQVGQQVEFRSVATAPMTPRTPTITSFPEIRKEAGIEEKMEVKDKKERVIEDMEKERVTEKEKLEGAEEDIKDLTDCKEVSEEPVQEVSWDEKGMTWEVYGAVVEVSVLGSAIQKHLEKQVKKQKPSMPPPPPLNPSAMPLSPESIQGGSGSGSGSGSGKGRPGKRGERDGEVSRRRRNPFRQLMENMQQPHCCSRAHTAE